jgi:hypothetical protein
LIEAVGIEFKTKVVDFGQEKSTNLFASHFRTRIEIGAKRLLWVNADIQTYWIGFNLE